MKNFLIIISVLFTACSHDYHEDPDYIYVRKSEVFCKDISEDVEEIRGSRGGSSFYKVITSRCIFTKTVRENYDSQYEERKSANIAYLEKIEQ